MHKPLKRNQLPDCYGSYEYKECYLCFVVTECMYQTTGQSHRQVIYMWKDLEEIKKEIYPELVKLGYIYPTNKLEHVPVMIALRAMAQELKKREG